ncbi:MAG: ubiquitin-related domain-containing protein [Piptocephalis tieghemiana]|nr:MAG: ubiquitin-related domain-containing protein [Piptocephalis tieghemiana]
MSQPNTSTTPTDPAKATLLEMGFSERKIERAYKATQDGKLGSPQEWLIEHAEDPSDAEDNSDSGIVEHANSLVCNDCGKKFKSEVSAERHAAISGHVDFAESTEKLASLTPEELAVKKKELRERMEAKREAKAKADAQEAREAEKARRDAGKKAALTREQLKDEEVRRAMEAQRRQKLEDKVARDRIKQQIEQDKRERALKRQREREAREAGENVGRAKETTPASKTPQGALGGGVDGKAYTTARLQIRMPSGQVITLTKDASSTLFDVAQAVTEETSSTPARFSTTFPRRTFTDEQMSQTLGDLGLVPSCVLVVQQVMEF